MVSTAPLISLSTNLVPPKPPPRKLLSIAQIPVTKVRPLPPKPLLKSAISNIS